MGDFTTKQHGKPAGWGQAHSAGLLYVPSSGQELFLKEHGRRFPPQQLAGVVVHPPLCRPHLLRLYGVKAGALGEKPSNQSVHVLIGPPLKGAVWVAEKHNGPLALAPVGGLDALEVLKLTAIVHRDALEQLIEQLAKTALQAVDGLDYAGRRVVLQQHHNAHTGPALGEDQEGLFGALAPHDTVHFPMPKTAPALDLLGAISMLLPLELRAACRLLLAA